MYLPLGITNGDEALIAERKGIISGTYSEYWLQVCWFGFFYVAFVVITYYVFPKNRRFPTHLIGLMNVVDWLHLLREVIKGGPISAINEYTIFNPTQDICAVLYLWANWVESAQFALGIFLSLVIYKSVVQKQEVHSNYRFKKILFIIFWVYTTCWTFLNGTIAAKDGYQVIKYSCSPLSTVPPTLGIVQAVVGTFIEAVLLGISGKYVIGVIKASPNGGRHRRKMWFTVRMVLIIIFQALPRIAFNLAYFTFASTGASNSILTTWATMVMLTQCYLLSATVALIGNYRLRRWVLSKYECKYVKSSDSSSSEYNMGSISITITDQNAPADNASYTNSARSESSPEV